MGPSLNDLSLLDIQPSQFYLSCDKIKAIETWFCPDDLSAFAPIPVKLLNGRIIFTDGHTRAYVAMRAGLKHVPLIWDEDEMDWDAYQRCVDACRERSVYAISDLAGRVLDAQEYQQKWLGWCTETFKKGR